MIYYIMTAW